MNATLDPDLVVGPPLSRRSIPVDGAEQLIGELAVNDTVHGGVDVQVQVDVNVI